MAKRPKKIKIKIKCRGYIPDGKGGWRSIEELTPQERKAYSAKLIETMGRALNEHFSEHPEEYARI